MTTPAQHKWRTLILTAVLAACLASSVGLALGDVDSEQAAPPQTDEDEQQMLVAMGKARELAEKLFYDVEVRFKDFRPSTVKEASQHFGYGWVNNMAMEHSLDKRVVTLPSVLVDPAAGVFLVADPDLNLANVAAIDLRTPDGDSYPLELAAVRNDQHALLLRAEGFAADVELPAFVEDVVEAGSEAILAQVVRFGRYRDIQVRGAGVQRHLEHGDEFKMLVVGVPGAQDGQYDRLGGLSMLLFNDQGELGGLLVSGRLVKVGDRMNYLTYWPTVEEGVGAAALEQTIDRAAAGLDRYLVPLSFRFRQAEGRRSRGRSRYYYGAEGPEDEWIAYGLAVDAGHIFVPAEIDKEKVERIESITAVLPSGRTAACRFEGLYREFGGMLLSCRESLEFPPDLWEERDIPEMAQFVDVSVKHRFGARDALAKYNRFFGLIKGYKDKEFRRPLRPILGGSFLLDAGGRLYGFATNEKRYESVERERGYGRRLGRGSAERCFAFADMRDRFLESAEHFDPKVKVKGIQERKELSWLGVEFQLITPELAKSLEAERETRAGKYGLLVNLVYAGSPAEKMGVAPGDLLLKVQEVGKAGEHLVGTEDWRMRYGGDFRSIRGGRRGGARLVALTWFNRQNQLTGLLTSLGPGTEALLTFSHDHEIKSVPFTVEKAPPDLKSAEKYKSDWTGLTVKDVTYEVRSILRLAEGFEGVVAYEVEPGSPAAVGRISAMEFVQQIDGRKLSNIGDFKAAIEALVAAGRKSATFKVRDLDESRFVEVQLEKSRKVRMNAGPPE